jgi:hypothetical protein
MKTIYLAKVSVEYEQRKSWIKYDIEMTVLTDSIFQIAKYPHSMDYIKQHLPTSSKKVRFRIRKIDLIKEIGKSFYYN